MNKKIIKANQIKIGYKIFNDDCKSFTEVINIAPEFKEGSSEIIKLHITWKENGKETIYKINELVNQKIVNMESGFKKIACEVLGITQRSYSNYSKQNRPIIDLLEKYFTKEEMQEFLETEKIERQEYFLKYSKEELEEYFKNNHNQKILVQIEELKKGLL